MFPRFSFQILQKILPWNEGWWVGYPLRAQLWVEEGFREMEISVSILKGIGKNVCCHYYMHFKVWNNYQYSADQLSEHVSIRKSPNYCGSIAGKVDLNSVMILQGSGGGNSIPTFADATQHTAYCIMQMGKLTSFQACWGRNIGWKQFSWKSNKA